MSNQEEIIYCQDCGERIPKGGPTRCRVCWNKYRSIKFAEEPFTRQEFKDLIRMFSFAQIGAKYKISEDAVKEWCELFNLPATKEIIDSYSNEGWDLT